MDFAFGLGDPAENGGGLFFDPVRKRRLGNKLLNFRKVALVLMLVSVGRMGRKMRMGMLMRMGM